ncbi:glycosyltransferase [Paracoccus sp. S-4012]|uniref:glycoside hydrolase family 99-like domain-containing protein n=1 Tax=Paracoccus sp. S-4012 TaxID=2665648 RepID=UPI0012B0BECB|nr:glycoside hydrolase family 99-like domain-containing protein [Paracoccus sp. S-4012]MRX50211.1 glycosyltransferase [Paracoccus sp. S-4012]
MTETAMTDGGSTAGARVQGTAAPAAQRLCLLVLGMHRSGTSMLTRVLNLAGFGLPEDLVGASPSNRLGHWEPERLVALHDDLLHGAGASWREWRPLNLAQMREGAGDYEAAIRDFLKRGTKDEPRLVLKEPRMSLTAPLTLAALDAAGCDSRCVLPFRNPLEVAASIERRNGIPASQAVLIWLRFTLEAERHSRGRRRSFVSYEALLSDWRGELARIFDQLELGPPPGAETDAAAGIAAFVRARERHERADAAALATEPATSGLGREVLDGLHAFASAPDDPALMARFDAARARLDEIAALTAPTIAAIEAEREAALSRASILANDVAVEQARNQRLQSAVDGIGQLHHQIVALNSKNDDFIAELRGQLEHARGEAAAREAELAAQRPLVAHVAALNAELESVRAEATRLESEAASGWDRASAHEAELAGLRSLAADVAALGTERDSARAQALRLEAELETVRQDAAAGWERAQALEASTSWRVTAPLRAVSGMVRGERPRIASGAAARALWLALPMGNATRARVKSTVFTRLAPIMRRSRLWQRWAEFNALPNAARLALPGHDPLAGADPVLGPAPAFEPMRMVADLAAPKARAVAFYLPQFHPIPENDAWWGEGFTEWTNVRAAEPQFPGHDQPKLPGELGYYDLRDPEVMRRQIELARRYGIGGFCFYWYWFGGHRLLEKPVENWLADPTLDFPFCIAWANENWSRRWDGKDSDVLIAQAHSPEDDLAFIAELAPYLRDRRYIRVGGRPLVIVYRPSLLPDPKATAARWRDWCRENGVGEIHLAYTQSFESADPAAYGFDAAIEFPPNNASPPELFDEVQGKREGFSAHVYDWTSYVARSRAYPSPGYRLYRSVNPAWDNTPRRKGNGGAVFLRSNPGQYREWVENAVARTRRDAVDDSDRLVFINAWNEWAEGAILEPDQSWGYAWLQATRDALDPGARPRHVLLVGHDAHPHGAQMLLLALARTLRANGIWVTILLGEGGPLLDDYRALGLTHILDPAKSAEARIARLTALRQQEGQVAIVNTAVTGGLLPELKAAGYRCVSLVHEMASVLRDFGLAPQARAIREHADAVVFAATAVQRDFEAAAGGPVPQAVIRPQGLYQRREARTASTAAEARRAVRAEFGVPASARLLLGVGYTDLRKGVDLFIDAVAAMHASGEDIHAIWLGHHDGSTIDALRDRIARHGLGDRLHLPGRRDDPRPFYDAADAYLLTSREDPYPSVVLEAMAAGVPVVLFEGATGAGDLAHRGLAVAVPRGDTGAMAEAATRLLAAPEATAAMTAAARDAVEAECGFTDYVFDLLALAGAPVPRISVIVPNYNYARYLPERIASIIAQDFPILEIIVLDDASTDDSLAVLEELAADSPRPIRIVPAEANSGNVFRQWRKGVAMARGDYVWIAEADDLAAPDFLTTAMAGFEAEGTVLAYTDSAQIDADGRMTAADYRYWVDTVDPQKWATSHASTGPKEVAAALYLKNTIPNASAVVMRADALRGVLDEQGEAITARRFTGDWLVYLALMRKGGAAFIAASKNLHRRHGGSVTVAGMGAAQLAEIAAVQKALAEEYGLDARHRQAARAYRAELAAQFGLPGNAAD